jgi:hypothetical protein
MRTIERTVRRWGWHVIGALTTISLLLMYSPLIFHNLPLPHMSAWWVVGWFLVSMILSVIAGLKASRWWFLVTALYGLTLLLLWVGEAIWEYHASPH